MESQTGSFGYLHLVWMTDFVIALMVPMSRIGEVDVEMQYILINYILLSFRAYFVERMINSIFGELAKYKDIFTKKCQCFATKYSSQ